MYISALLCFLRHRIYGVRYHHSMIPFVSLKRNYCYDPKNFSANLLFSENDLMYEMEKKVL